MFSPGFLGDFVLLSSAAEAFFEPAGVSYKLHDQFVFENVVALDRAYVLAGYVTAKFLVVCLQCVVPAIPAADLPSDAGFDPSLPFGVVESDFLASRVQEGSPDFRWEFEFPWFSDMAIEHLDIVRPMHFRSSA